MSNKRGGLTGILILIFIMLVWGSSYTITKSIVTVMPPVTLAFVRFVIATLCILPIYLSHIRKTESRVAKKDYLWLGLMGMSGITGYYTFFNFSLLYTSASVGALIQGFMPACIALSGLIFLKERLSKRKIAGIVLAFAGVMLIGFISAHGGGDGQPNSLKGNIFMIVSVGCWTAYTLISRKLQHIPPIKLTFFSGCAGTLLLFPMAIYEYCHYTKPIEPGTFGWLALLYLGGISSALCYLLYNRALKELPAAVVGNFLNLDILTGVIIAVIFLNEQISTVQIVGGILILCGLFLSSESNKSASTIH